MATDKIMQLLKGRASNMFQAEFPELKKKYWKQHMLERGYFCGTVGKVDEKIKKEYIENQGKQESNEDFKIVAKEELF